MPLILQTTLMRQQRQAIRAMVNREYFALLMEQGTGKTLVLLAHVIQLYNDGELDAACVVAPNGVHINWITEELPKHVQPTSSQILSAYWTAGANKREQLAMDVLYERKVGENPFRLFSINIEALAHDSGFKAIEHFLSTFPRVALIIDESQRIKNISAQCTKRLMKLRKYASHRYISTGTAIEDSPVDAFSQFQFLESGLLGTTSLVAFRAEYCELLPPDNALMRHIVARSGGRFQPQVIAKDADGNKKYRNLDKLRDLIKPHSFRVLKKDCLDLPDKVYKTVPFRMTTTQRKVYDQLASQFRIELKGGRIDTFSAMNSLQKLQQVTSGYIRLNDGSQHLLRSNPRIEALLSTLEDITDPSIIIWAHFRQELDDIACALAKANISHRLIHGDVKPLVRKSHISDFQAGKFKALLSQTQVGGTGFTLTAAHTVIYYSNTFRLGPRVQSEDRAHRIGQTEHVVYIDIVALDSIDQRIALSLQRKQEVASEVLGDFLFA